MASSYLRTPALPPSTPLLATVRRVRSFGSLPRVSRTNSGCGVTQEEAALHLYLFLSMLDLLDQLSSCTLDLEGYDSESNPDGPTIREQVVRLEHDREGNFSFPLGKNLKNVGEKFLTISQNRNIKRQAHLDEVSQRNDSVFFATIGAFVILSPLLYFE